MRVTEDPQEDPRRLGSFRVRPLSLSRQYLRGILVQPEFEDTATEFFRSKSRVCSDVFEFSCGAPGEIISLAADRSGVRLASDT